MTNRSILLLALVLVLVAFYALLVLKPQHRLPMLPVLESEGTSYEEVERFLKDFEKRGLADVKSVGKTVLGKTIYAVYPKTAAKSGDAGRLLVVAGQHGVEPVPVDAVMQMIDQGLFRSSRLEIVIIPVANPDGLPYFYRFNWNNVDLNRDWPNLSQPETIAISKYIKKYDPDVVIDIHEGRPYCVEIAQSTNPSRHRLAAAGAARARSKEFDLELLPNSPGPGSGLLHRVAGIQGRVGLMLESPSDIDPEYREPVYAAFVSGVVDEMVRIRWKR